MARMTSHLIGSRDVARILGVTRSTVKRRAGLGQLPYVDKLPGTLGNYLFDREVIEELAKEGK